LDFCQTMSCTHAVQSMYAHMSESLYENGFLLAQMSLDAQHAFVGLCVEHAG